MEAIKLTIMVLWVTTLVGWVMNIVAIVNLEELTITGKVVIGIIGVFVPPLGAIMGLFIW